MKTTIQLLRRSKWTALVGLMAIGLTSCGKEDSGGSNGGASNGGKSKLPVIVTTTTMVTDLVRQVAGDSFEIQPLMEPGVDPHLYKPTSEDMAKLSKCKVIVYSGLHLEGRMVDVFKRLEAQDKLTVSLGDRLPEAELLRIKGAEVDPHIWGDAKLWSLTLNPLVEVLCKAEPNRREDFQKRAREVQKQLIEAHEWLKKRVDTLPRRSRTLITSHDAFRYFGRAYGFEVVGVQGISTDSEAGLNDIARVVDIIKSKQVKAVFIESSVSPATIKNISKDSGAIIGGELLSDACGLPGEMVDVGNGEKVDRGTVIGMLKYNMHTVVTSLMP